MDLNPLPPTSLPSPERRRGAGAGFLLLLALALGLAAPLSLAACKDHSGHGHDGDHGHGSEGAPESTGDASDGTSGDASQEPVEGPGSPESLESARAAWDRALADYQVGGGLDYAGLAADREDLDAYLAFAAQADPAGWSEDEQRAFWINTYNAVVASAVLREYPGLESVQKVDGFFKRARHLIAGEPRTLDEIEGEGLALGDPRVHFAVVCASASCPSLRGEAYRGSQIDAQLEDQTQAFLDDPEKGFRLEPEDDTVYLSKIFNWYKGDFGGEPVAWVLDHLPENLAARLGELQESGRLKLEYMDYSWALNDEPRPEG